MDDGGGSALSALMQRSAACLSANCGCPRVDPGSDRQPGGAADLRVRHRVTSSLAGPAGRRTPPARFAVPLVTTCGSYLRPSRSSGICRSLRLRMGDCGSNGRERKPCWPGVVRDEPSAGGLQAAVWSASAPPDAVHDRLVGRPDYGRQHPDVPVRVLWLGRIDREQQYEPAVGLDDSLIVCLENLHAPPGRGASGRRVRPRVDDHESTNSATTPAARTGGVSAKVRRRSALRTRGRASTA